MNGASIPLFSSENKKDCIAIGCLILVAIKKTRANPIFLARIGVPTKKTQSAARLLCVFK